MLVLFVVAILLLRNVPLVLRPFLAPPEERNVTAAIVPAVTVILAVVILVVAWKSSQGSLISWPL